MKILIVGDSFAADWSVKYPNVFGWPNLLAEKYTVTNLAQAGVSEYKIYKQLTSVNLDLFDLIIVTHTSPYRIVTKNHPVHYNDCLHKNTDLLFSDIEYHSKTLKGFFSRSLRSAYSFFIFHFDQEYYELMYQLLIERIKKILRNKCVITIVPPIAMNEYITTKNKISISRDQLSPGLTNHLSSTDNQQLFEKITQKINEIKQP
jgi:hypothetical protein